MIVLTNVLEWHTPDDLPPVRENDRGPRSGDCIAFWREADGGSCLTWAVYHHDRRTWHSLLMQTSIIEPHLWAEVPIPGYLEATPAAGRA